MSTEKELTALIADNVRLTRLARGISQQQLARRLGLTFQQVQKYEKGRNRISASRLHQIARILNVPVASFFEGLEDAAARTDMQKVISAYDRMSPQFGTRELVELNRAFMAIPDACTRRRLAGLAEHLAAAL